MPGGVYGFTFEPYDRGGTFDVHIRPYAEQMSDAELYLTRQGYEAARVRYGRG